MMWIARFSVVIGRRRGAGGGYTGPELFLVVPSRHADTGDDGCRSRKGSEAGTHERRVARFSEAASVRRRNDREALKTLRLAQNERAVADHGNADQDQGRGQPGQRDGQGSEQSTGGDPAEEGREGEAVGTGEDR